MSFFLLREIEASLALLKNATWDDEARKFGLLLPASKTDPGAASVYREWGCLCSSPEDLATPCPWHAAVRLRSTLGRRFGTLGGDIAGCPAHLSLFPSCSGGVLSKDSVVTCFERAATALGEPLRDTMGRRRYGGHSGRVSGARYLGSIGVELYKLAILARWASDTILQYVKMAPMRTLTDDCKRLLTGTTIDKVVADVRASIGADSAKLQVLDSNLRYCISQQAAIERRLASLSTQSVAIHVVNNNTLAAHRSASNLESQPSPNWKTVCGWRFAGANFCVHRGLSDSNFEARHLCKTCCPGSSELIVDSPSC